MKAKKYAYLYRKAAWFRLRKIQLQAQPLCNFCNQLGIITAATVADHIIPHKGNEELFFDQRNLQSLCRNCHNITKQQIEVRGYASGFGEDGYPLDDNHPAYRSGGVDKVSPRSGYSRSHNFPKTLT